jgi:RNA-directed DNA polymerase
LLHSGGQPGGDEIHAGDDPDLAHSPANARTLAEIARQINPLLRGWINYCGRFSRSALSSLADYVNQKLRSWITRKYKRFRFHKTRASLFLRRLARDNKDLFVHWQAFGTTTFT